MVMKSGSKLVCDVGGGSVGFGVAWQDDGGIPSSTIGPPPCSSFRRGRAAMAEVTGVRDQWRSSAMASSLLVMKQRRRFSPFPASFDTNGATPQLWTFVSSSSPFRRRQHAGGTSCDNVRSSHPPSAGYNRALNRHCPFIRLLRISWFEEGDAICKRMSSNYSGSGEWIPEVRCWCGEIAPVRMSWSYANPGKRFRACPRYGVRGNGNCRYFQWLDSDVSDRVAKVIRGLLKRLDKQDMVVMTETPIPPEIPLQRSSK
nr:GRF zinc finger protein [Ipomoea batatas]